LTTILIIEPSATLRYGIKRAINLPGIELQEEDDCRQAIVRLSCLPQHTAPPAVIILGWPTLAKPEFMALSKLLCESPCNKLPLLLMVQDMALFDANCLFERDYFIVQKWRDMEEIEGNLQRLLTSSAERGVIAERVEDDRIRILLVDDSKTIRTQFGNLLKREGYAVELAASPSEAFEKAKAQRFDIGIIDYYMPEQNGAELCQRIKQDPRCSPMDLAVLTGSYDDALVSSVLASGAIECMFKNESSQLFLARVKALVQICQQKKIIREEKEQLNNILESVGEGVYGVNREGIITFINPAALSILGYELESDLLGKLAHAVFHYADQSGKPVESDFCFIHQAYQLGDELLQWEAVFWSARGSAVPVECSVRPRMIEGRSIGSVIAFRDISERLLFEEELKWQVNHDHLTKLLNRQYLDQALEQETRRLFRTGETSALLFIDLDRFKNVNDLAGHAAGDLLLIEVSNKLKERVRQSDIIARIAGDEFVVILSNVKLEQALLLAEKIRGILDETIFHYGDMTFDITGSVGLTMMDACSFSVERVLANADAACHIAKQHGRNKIHVFDEEKDVSAFDEKERGWIDRLGEALEKAQFSLSYHPIYATSTVQPLLNCNATDHNTSCHPQGVPDFYEVQVQLPDANGHLLSSDAFIPAAERFDLITKIDLHVIERVIRLLDDQDKMQTPLRFAVTLSEQTLVRPDFIETVEGWLSSISQTPDSLLITLRDDQSGSNTKSLQKTLEQLHAKGFGVILDEQMRAHSAFAHLRQYHAAYITINETFIDGLLTDPIDQAVVRAIVDVSHAQNRKTIARNVHSLDTCRLLTQLNIDYLQSDLLGEWVSEDELVRLIRTLQSTKQA
jgi:diguanylate cyclase (GGDEF)-like protein/PAS domain S-box-containing protein